MRDIDSIIGNNIRLLRKHYHVTQQTLADLLNYTPSVISMIEKGTRSLPEDLLPVIAERFTIPVKKLLEPITPEELSERDLKIGKKQLYSVYGAMYSCYTTTEAMENPNFSKAVDYYLRITTEGNIIPSMIHECEMLFLKSFREDGILLGAANTISLILFQFGLIGILTPAESREFEDFDVKKAEKLADITVANRGDSAHDFIEKYTETFNECVLALNSNNEYKELAEFFIAKKYLLGMTENAFSTEVNSYIGLAMISELTFLNNSYAKKFTEKASKLTETS